ncbi:cyclic di-AMP synthase CdaA [Planctomycetota bacterium]|nr:cyclic di-AMP synthase CdaA [Planctomycetota bacterium]
MFGVDWSEAAYWLRSAVEISILWAVIYAILASLERISAGGKLKGLSLGLGLVVLAWMLARYFQLHAITWLLQASIGVAALGLLVVFQPELRRLFSRLGGVFPQGDQRGVDAATVSHLVDALVTMSTRQIGGLVVIERNDRLDDYIRSSPFDCDLTAKSLVTVFWKDSPLHDGAVVVRGGRIVAAGVILPLTTKADYLSLSGTRHRAAIGISEDTDAIALVVSEETGTISLAERGELQRGLSRQDLDVVLNRYIRAAKIGASTSQPLTGRHRRRRLLVSTPRPPAP